jgi:hypothetical protein
MQATPSGVKYENLIVPPHPARPAAETGFAVRFRRIAHSALAPVPGAFSNVQCVLGGMPQTRFMFRNPTH